MGIIVYEELNNFGHQGQGKAMLKMISSKKLILNNVLYVLEI